MNTKLECIPCFFKQSIIALKLSGIYQEIEKNNHGADKIFAEIITAVAEEAKKVDFSKPPAWTTTFIHKRIRDILKTDPFKGVKTEYNKIALSLYPQLKEIVFRSTDHLLTATRLAIAGNAIDFGIFSSVDIEGTIKRAMEDKLAVDHYEFFKRELSTARQCLYLLDNAGEIVFDRILIEVLRDMGIKVIAVVKGAPVLNDCTIEDAFETSLHEIAEVIDNGSDAIGTIFELSSESFKRVFQDTPLVISKGQGNFETLTTYMNDSYFGASQNSDSICGHRTVTSRHQTIHSDETTGINPQSSNRRNPESGLIPSISLPGNRSSRDKHSSNFLQDNTGISKKIFFLFQSKCEVVSRELGLPLGSMLLFYPSSQTCV